MSMILMNLDAALIGSVQDRDQDRGHDLDRRPIENVAKLQPPMHHMVMRERKKRGES